MNYRAGGRTRSLARSRGARTATLPAPRPPLRTPAAPHLTLRPGPQPAPRRQTAAAPLRLPCPRCPRAQPGLPGALPQNQRRGRRHPRSSLAPPPGSAVWSPANGGGSGGRQAGRLKPRRGRAAPVQRSWRGEGVSPSSSPPLPPFRGKAVHILIYLYVNFCLFYIYTHTWIWCGYFYVLCR